ncbi:hypothetical protein BpHYR1_024982 [Brachionus plicatilis]|uniref:Uncharacterized protein n=1 Tax=Brachionus plicatilis TaxID=10195 RepID=A0A3M7RVC0_BRAPC|nr:hypothetical protein BpHYR1_024982 [Brachionus plicatilis]
MPGFKFLTKTRSTRKRPETSRKVAKGSKSISESQTRSTSKPPLKAERKRFEVRPSTPQETRKLCLQCEKSDRMIAHCFSRKNQMSMLELKEKNNKPVNFLLDAGTVSTIVSKRILDQCKTPGAALEPLNETLETCVGGPVGKGRCSLKLIGFE